ncbi:MAG: Ig domain-containing protein group 1 domain-containing protein, partial [Chloroflexi bacterium]
MARKGIVMTLFVVGLLASTLGFATLPVAGADNPVVVENQQPGSAAWTLTKTADDVNNQIKGYASLTSVLQGGSISFSISVNPAQAYSIDVYRIGYYGGLGGRLRLHDGPFNGTPQAACVPDATTGMIACNWPTSYMLTVPGDWTSGVYLAVLTNAAGYQNYINFVVRDGRPAAFLYQEGINTAQAYNNYPNDKLTGKSLYEFNSFGANTVAGTTRAVKVSFDRPYANDGSGQLLSWELQLVRWLEHAGYDVTYSADVDTHANAAELLNHKAFFTAGHDEYWSNEMYNAAQAARDAGVNLAFFGANAVYWQVRYESSAGGATNRVMVCYKSGSIDPV